MRRVIITTLTVLAVAPAAAFGAWSTPVTISSPHTFISGLKTVLLPSGAEVAAFGYQDGVGQDAPGGARFVVRVAGGSYGREHALPAGFLDLRGYGASRLIALALNGAHVQVALGTTSLMGAAQTLFTGDLRFQPELAADSAGDAVVAWIQGASHNRRLVSVATRRAGGHFSAPTTLVDSGRADALAVAISRAGTVVAFERGGRLDVRAQRSGHGWSTLQDIGSAATGTENDIQAAVSVQGRFEVVWRHRQLTEGGTPAPSVLDAAYMASSGARFHRSVRIETSGAGAPSLLPDNADVLISYSERTAAGPVARLRRLTPAIGPARDSAPAGGLTDVVAGLDPATDSAYATWMVPQAGGDGAGKGFLGFPPTQEAVTPSEAVQELRTFDHGGLSAVWIARPQGTGPGIPIAKIHTVLRTADRTTSG